MPEFWFVMQIAMRAGFATSYPVNGLLRRKGIEEKMWGIARGLFFDAGLGLSPRLGRRNVSAFTLLLLRGKHLEQAAPPEPAMVVAVGLRLARGAGRQHRAPLVDRRRHPEPRLRAVEAIAKRLV